MTAWRTELKFRTFLKMFRYKKIYLACLKQQIKIWLMRTHQSSWHSSLNNLWFASVSTRFQHGNTAWPRSDIQSIISISNLEVFNWRRNIHPRWRSTWRLFIGCQKNFTKSTKHQSILNRISFQLLKAANEGCRRRDLPWPHIFKHLASPHPINVPESVSDLLSCHLYG